METRVGSIPGQQEIEGAMFPLVIAAADADAAHSMGDVGDWLRRESNGLSQQLARHGAILFRGFSVESDKDFDQFVDATGSPNFTYRESLSNAVRVNRTERVFTANEAPADVTIFLHHEMAQTPVYPSSLFFYCERAAEEGGATPLCRSDVLLERLEQIKPDFVSACRELGLRYSNVMPGDNDAQSGMGRSWRSTLNCEERGAAEERLKKLDYSWEWLEGDCLRVTTPVLPAIRRLSSGRDAFFNQLIAAFKGWKDARNDPGKSICFGDGTPLDRDAVQVAVDLGEELSFDLPWQNGDVAWVDNFSTMHGRRSFKGTRKVLASLVA